VKRYVFYILGSLTLVISLALVLGCYWLMATPTGSDWLIRTLANRAPETFAVQSVEGRLTDELILSGVALHWDGGEVSIGRLGWRWRATGLLHRNVRIRSLSLDDVTLVTQSRPDEPDTPLDFSWPELPGWLDKLHVALDEVQVQRLTWKQPDAEPFYVEGVATKARWARRRLRIPWLTVLCDAGTVTARLEADWRRQRLQLQAAALLKTSPGNDIPMLLAGSAQPAQQPETLAGRLILSGHSPMAGSWQLATPYALAPTDVSLKDLDLRSLSGNGTLHGKAQLDWAQAEPQLDLTATLKDLDLMTLTGQATNLSGSLAFKGGLEAFEGQLALANQARDWRKLELKTSFSGSPDVLNLSRLKILGLDGEIGGELTAHWAPEMVIQGTFTGRGLNPEAAGLTWPGQINLQAEGTWSRPQTGPVTAELQAKLLPSTLRGYPLRGGIDARLQGQDLQIKALDLQSRGVDVSARGRLKQRIDFNAKVEDLAGLLPELAGAVQGRGWVRWRDHQLAGQITGNGRNLRYDPLRIQRLNFAASLADNRTGTLKADLAGIKHDQLDIPSVTLQGQGRLDRHSLSARITLPKQTRLQLAAVGGYTASRWQGSLTELSLQDTVGSLRLASPAALTVSQRELRLDALRLTGKGDEQLSAHAQLQFSPLTGNAALDWQNIRLAHAQPWIADAKLTGTSTGKGAWRQTGKETFDLSAELQLAGRFEQERLQLELNNAAASVHWNPDRLRADVTADLKDGGALQGFLEGGRSARMALPEQARWELSCSALNLERLAPWLPPDIQVKGILSGTSEGKLLADRNMIAAGQIRITDGYVLSRNDSGQVSVPVQTAAANWSWRDQSLTGTTNLQLGDYGRLQGQYRLPIPARLPVTPQDKGPLEVTLEGRSAELGLLSVLMPGVVQETRGRIEINLHAGGTWGQPRLEGQARLLEAGAYLPVAGIELRDVGLVARLDGDRILLDSLSLRSGDGTLRGAGSLQLQDWKPGTYDLTLKGARVQLINLPELQVLADPELRMTGSPAGIKVAGTIGLPEVMIRDNKKPSVVSPSEDVVIIGQEIPEKQRSDFNIQADIKLELGDHVLVKASGLDARLSGALRLTAIGAKALNAEGRITVAEGQYAAYGTRLDITRGNLLFNGSLDQPTLDILALRTVGKVKAGVQVSGTPRSPVVKLTSDPAMSDSDRLAYIVLGRATARNAGEADLLMTAGGVLLSQGESVVLRDRLKRSLGVDVLGIEQGTTQDDVSGSMLTIGKYLSPSLYVSIGQSLFTNTQAFRLRYSLGERWELESTTGEESGVDLFYKIEFR
jgi:translocation and assembly module TamB